MFNRLVLTNKDGLKQIINVCKLQRLRYQLIAGIINQLWIRKTQGNNIFNVNGRSVNVTGFQISPKNYKKKQYWILYYKIVPMKSCK